MHICETCGTPGPAQACPHCGAVGAKRRSPHWALSALGLAVTTVALQGCVSMYGIISTFDGEADLDGDGWQSSLDCDDSNPEVNPGAEEIAGDGTDSDCDGLDDPQA